MNFRLFYYINVGCLEGEQELPHPEHIKTFDDLANWLPNLSGIIYNNRIKNKYNKTVFFERYHENLRDCYDASYDDRGIDLAIKCGISGTEEIGVRRSTPVKFFDVDFSKNERGLYKLTPTNELPITIKGTSEKNGFSTRTNTL